MRFCLACRYISADGPLCTRCGRSFGGRLCQSKKQRHLNPPDALYCGQCGSQSLTDAADYIALGCPAKLLLLGGLAAILWFGFSFVSQSGGLSFTEITGYRSPLVWVMEKSGSALIIIFLIFFFSAFIPGEAGRQFRKVFTTACVEALRFFFTTLHKAFVALFGLLRKSPTKRP